ncbi:MAG: hypothetical protein QOG49_1336 [Frankiaceae bacterium]|jgi:hypothetical protein|nr:hypothetical protein [Frankiaceae bacterium]
MAASLDGRDFTVVDNAAGEVDAATVFSYQEDDGVVSARYAGGAIRLGYLVGTRRGDDLDFRYVHLGTTGETASGRCASRIEVLEDGRLRLHENWSWESRDGSGNSTVEELQADELQSRGI